MKGIGRILATSAVLVGLVTSCGPTKPWTKTDKAFAVFYLVGHSADMVTTERVLDNPNNYEMNPLLGRHPSDTEVLLWGAATPILMIYLADRFPRLRKSLLFIGGALGMGLAIHNSQL